MTTSVPLESGGITVSHKCVTEDPTKSELYSFLMFFVFPGNPKLKKIQLNISL